jgi:hypothetical protein
MMITDEHLEYATVERLRQMLVDVHDDYRVTHSYALFTTILCWVMQRIRANGNDPVDVRARSVHRILQRQRIEDEPWSVVTAAFDDGHDGPAYGPFVDFAGFTADRFLPVLRNATAHGDGRNIKPINQNGWLIGHEFGCNERNERRQVIWRGTIVLLRSDMRRIGCALADLYCQALAARDGQPANPNLAEESRLVREELQDA